MGNDVYESERFLVATKNGNQRGLIDVESENDCSCACKPTGTTFLSFFRPLGGYR